MPSEALREARRFEEEEEKKLEGSLRPNFHLSPRVGWMNDPNGFSYYKDRYHLFYQYHPYNTFWGPMHWGHAVSKDLLHWEYLPAAMAPDKEYDYAGCFSGSAITLENGKHLLVYTGVSKEKTEDGRECDVQTQCLAVGDGEEYEKYGENPVIDAGMLPKNSSRADFRDPHVYFEDGVYKLVAVNRAGDGYGSVLLFSSKDGFEWEFEKVLKHNDDGKFGVMWECPDYFSLNGKKVLFLSVQEMEAKDLEFTTGNGNICMIGSADKDDNFVSEFVQTIDYGYDFYGQQTLLAPDGRRLMIGWMQNWDNINYRAGDCKWYGQMSVPREIRIENNRLYQWPIREINSIRKNRIEYSDVSLCGKKTFEGIEGRSIDLELSIKPENEEELFQSFSINFAEDKEHHVLLKYIPNEGVVEFDRSQAGSRNGIVHSRKCKVYGKAGYLKLRIILDIYSAEVFINDGESAMTLTFYTDVKAKGISFEANGNVNLSIEKYEL